MNLRKLAPLAKYVWHLKDKNLEYDLKWNRPLSSDKSDKRDIFPLESGLEINENGNVLDRRNLS